MASPKRDDVCEAVIFGHRMAAARLILRRQATGFRTKSPPRLSHYEKSVKPGTRRAFFCSKD